VTRRSLSVVGGMAAALALMIAPASSQAACYSSTPNTQVFADSPFDGDSGLAPELAGVGIAVDSGCGVVADPVVVNRPFGLFDGDGVGIYIDTDGNPATGSPIWNGADRVIITAGSNVADLPPGLGVWNGTTFSFAANPFLPKVGDAGARATIDQLGIAAPATVGVRVASIWSGIFNTYGDFAPEPLVPSFAVPVSFSNQAPPVVTPAPAPAPAPVPVAAPVTTPSVAPKPAKACRVPSVRGMPANRARAKLKAAGCRYTIKAVTSKTREGRVVSLSRQAGTKTTATIVVKVSRGAHRAHARAAGAVDPAAIYTATSARLTAAEQSGSR
jgi:PASTA domain-containing protein